MQQAALDVLNQASQSQKQSTPVLVQRNWVLWSLGDLAEMRKGIDQGLARERSADLLIQDGLWKLRSGDPAAARKAIEEALKIDPSDLRALQALSQTYVAQKNAPMALQRVKEYAASQPKSAPVQDFLGMMLMSQGSPAEARKAFAAAKAANPKYVQADLALTQLDVAQGNLNDAKKRLEAILSVNAGNPTAQLWLGIIEEKMGDRSAAMEAYRKVAEANPGSAQALNNLAYLLSEVANKPDEALKYAQEAVQLVPETASILRHAGMDSLPKRSLQRGCPVFGAGGFQQYRKGQRGVEVSLGNGLQQSGGNRARPGHAAGRTEAESESSRGEDRPADDRIVPLKDAAHRGIVTKS